MLRLIKNAINFINEASGAVPVRQDRIQEHEYTLLRAAAGNSSRIAFINQGVELMRACETANRSDPRIAALSQYRAGIADSSGKVISMVVAQSSPGYKNFYPSELKITTQGLWLDTPASVENTRLIIQVYGTFEMSWSHISAAIDALIDEVVRNEGANPSRMSSSEKLNLVAAVGKKTITTEARSQDIDLRRQLAWAFDNDPRVLRLRASVVNRRFPNGRIYLQVYRDICLADDEFVIKIDGSRGPWISRDFSGYPRGTWASISGGLDSLVKELLDKR